MIDERTARSTAYTRRGCRWGNAGLWARTPTWWENQSGTPGPGEPLAPDIRASDGERNAVVDKLSEHLQTGRLDMDEFQKRTERALGARTRRDLAGLLTDLPPEERSPSQPRPPRWALIPVGLVIVAVLVAISLAATTRHGFWFPWWLIPIGFFLTRRFWHRSGAVGRVGDEAIAKALTAPAPRTPDAVKFRGTYSAPGDWRPGNNRLEENRWLPWR